MGDTIFPHLPHKNRSNAKGIFRLLPIFHCHP